MLKKIGDSGMGPDWTFKLVN